MLARHLALEQAVAGSPLVLGNRVVLLEDGPTTYQAMFAAIAAARDHINMETYILEDDEVGQRFADALIAKQQQGVQVNLIHDSVGTLGTPKEFFKRLQRRRHQGARVQPGQSARPPRPAGTSTSATTASCWSSTGASPFLGGINISSVYSGGSFSQRLGSSAAATTRPALARHRPAARRAGRRASCRSSSSRPGKARRASRSRRATTFRRCQARGQEVVRAIGSSPDEPYSQIYVTLISAIDSAETEIWLTNAYFVPDPQLLAALNGAVGARRRREADPAEQHRFVRWSSTPAARTTSQLLRGGVKIYERRDALLHAKTAVIDGVWSTVGSTNLDWRSFLHNQELNAVVLGTEFGAKMRAAFERDLAASDADHARGMAAAADRRACQGIVRSHCGSTGCEHASRSSHVLRAPPASPCRPRSLAAPASAQDAATLRARHAALQDKFASNQFGRPLVLESIQTSGDLKGDVYARRRPSVRRWSQQALQATDHWCDILILHLNVKRCRAGARDGKTINLSVGRKFDQPLEDAYQLDFAYRVVAATADYLQVLLTADEGPLSTKNYRIVVEAVPVDAEAQRRPHVVCVRLRLRGPRGDADLPGDGRARQGRLHASSAASRRQARLHQAACAACSSATRCATTWRSTPTCRPTRCRRPSSSRSACATGTRAPSATPPSSTRWSRTSTST